jgi:hypothetical protein
LFGVWVKDASSINACDKDYVVNYTVQSAGTQPVSIVSLVPNLSSPQAANTPITWTCTATGGTSLLYQFWEYTAATGWIIKQPYTASNTYIWTPTTAGDHLFGVWVKDASSVNACDKDYVVNYIIQGTGQPDWYYLKVPDGHGNFVDVYMKDNGDDANGNVNVRVMAKKSTDILWNKYIMSGDVWSQTPGIFAFNPSEGGAVVCSLGLFGGGDVQTAGLDYEQWATQLEDAILAAAGLERDDVEDADIDMLVDGIIAGIDDNFPLLKGLLQHFGLIDTHESDIYFMGGKCLMDYSFILYYKNASLVADVAGTQAMLDAGVLSVSGLLAASTGVLAPAGGVVELAAGEEAVRALVLKVAARLLSREAVKSGILAAQDSVKLQACIPPSQILKQSMVNHGFSYPPYKFATHHMVVRGAKLDRAVLARAILSEYNIGWDSWENGVFLPMEAGHGTATVHASGRHHDSYIINVYNRLSAAKNDAIADGKSWEEIRTAIVNELHLIRTELLNGTIAL